jgi:hypothetical protein
MHWLSRLLLMALVASALALSACRQGVGERCQVDSDCDDNLHCVLPAGGSPQSGGTCQGQGSDMATPTGDMTAPSDMTALPDLSGHD